MSVGHRHYIPILKGRLGEFTALSYTPTDQLGRFTPLLEVVPGGVEFDDEGDPTPESVKIDVDRFIERATSKWPDRPMIVDASLVPGSPGSRPPIIDVIEGFGRRGQIITPVVRPSDADDVIRGIRDALAGFMPAAACIRLAGEDLDDTVVPIPAAIDRVLGLLEIGPSQVDLILDFGAIGDEQSASFAARITRLMLAELPFTNEWNTLALAAGSFPTDLNAVQPNVLTALPRHDAGIWRGVRGRITGRMPSFADYAVAHPVMPATAGFAPAPQLRYTVSQEWLVMKGRKTDRRGSRQFFDICRAVARHPEFTPELSWGDTRIAAAVQFDDEQLIQQIGTGNAMTWRAIGTSHHIGFVVSRLATHDEP